MGSSCIPHCLAHLNIDLHSAIQIRFVGSVRVCADCTKHLPTAHSMLLAEIKRPGITTRNE